MRRRRWWRTRRRVLSDVEVRQGPVFFFVVVELSVGEDEALLVLGKAMPLVNLGLDIVYCI